ncbi:MAG TPA: BON domain-containing protein [Bryobacteraceae bacterium]|nr:BON domain-containing protein [Bryobacteraceae bacterium]
MNKMIRRFSQVAALAAMAVTAFPVFARSAPEQDLSAQVRHQLVMLPFFNVFDDLNYSVNDGVVTLSGAVTQPVVKEDAGRVVKRIPGVLQVVNNIRVLPLSSLDNRIRFAEYRAIFGYSDLYRYAMGANPSIHIIVENGHVTLTGVVSSQADKQVAYLRANGVPGVFSVTNDLRVAERS